MIPPLVTVVVINYNYERFLGAAIDSALGQTYQKVQVIVVDDGSTDGSRDVAQTYGDRIIRINKANGGHTSSVNAGFAASSGCLVSFLDADDVLYPGCVERVVSNWCKGLAKVQFQLDIIDARGGYRATRFPNFPSDLDSDAVTKRAMKYGFYPWSVSSGNIYARSFLSEIFPISTEKFPRVPDGYINKLAPLFGGVLTLREPLAAYRVHGANDLARSRTVARKQDYSRFVQFEKDLHQEFALLASRLGHTVAPFEAVPLPQYFEYRVLSARVTPGEHPIAGDTRARLLLLSFRTAGLAPDLSPLGRVVWATWLIALVLLPLRFLMVLVQICRSDDDRVRLARWLIERSRRTHAYLAP